VEHSHDPTSKLLIYAWPLLTLATCLWALQSLRSAIRTGFPKPACPAAKLRVGEAKLPPRRPALAWWEKSASILKTLPLPRTGRTNRLQALPSGPYCTGCSGRGFAPPPGWAKFPGACPNKKNARNLGTQFLESKIEVNLLLCIARVASQRRSGAGSVGFGCQIPRRAHLATGSSSGRTQAIEALECKMPWLVTWEIDLSNHKQTEL